MKQIYKYFLPLCAVLGLLILAGCSNVFDASSPAEVGGLKVSVGSADARTLLPNTQFTGYRLAITKDDEPVGEPVTFSSQSTVVKNLPAGNLLLKVTGFVTINGTQYPAAYGEKLIENFDPNTPAQTVAVDISAQMEGDDGFFSYNVTFPANLTVTAANLKLVALSDGTTEVGNVDLLGEGNNAGYLTEVVETETVLKGITPGYYLMTITVTDNKAATAGRVEVVHIYANMETTAKYTFKDADFDYTKEPEGPKGLGAFTWEINDNQNGWGFGGFNGNLDMELLANAKYLVLEKSGGGNPWGLGGLTVFLQEGSNWSQTAVTTGWENFDFSSGTWYFVIETSKLDGFATVSQAASGGIGLAYYADTLADFGIQEAYLISSDVTRPDGAYDIANSENENVYGFYSKDFQLPGAGGDPEGPFPYELTLAYNSWEGGSNYQGVLTEDWVLNGGDAITSGETYDLTISFSSDTAISGLQFSVQDQNWSAISGSQTIESTVVAETSYTKTITFVATGTAADNAAASNKIAIYTNDTAIEDAVKLTITGFELKKINVPAGFTYLGKFNQINNDTQAGWNNPGTITDNLLVLEVNGVGDNADGFGGLQIAFNGNGVSGGWGQTAVTGGWTSFSRGDTAYLVIDLSALGQWDEYIVANEWRQLYVCYGSGPDVIASLGLKAAFLSNKALMAKPTDGVDLTPDEGNTVYGFITKDATIFD